MSLDENMKPRLNASMLTNFVGKNVSLLGIVKHIDNGGNSLILTTSDNKVVKVMMQEPLNQMVSGLTEVYGTVKSPDAVICDDLVVIPEETAAKFNMALYQKAVELTHKCNQQYIQGGNIED